MAEAGNVKDALSGTLHNAVTQLPNTEGFWISSEVYSSVVCAGESHLPVAGSAPWARRAGHRSGCADGRLEVNVVSDIKHSLLSFSCLQSTSLYQDTVVWEGEVAWAVVYFALKTQLVFKKTQGCTMFSQSLWLPREVSQTKALGDSEHKGSVLL